MLYMIPMNLLKLLTRIIDYMNQFMVYITNLGKKKKGIFILD